MLKGIITVDGVFIPSQDALAYAAKDGHVGGIPLAALVKMLDVWDVQHPSASQIAGGAWRRTVLEHILDYYAPPQSLVAMLRGSLIHKGLESLPFPKGLKVIQEKRLKCLMPGHKDIVLSGQIDLYFPTEHRLEDFKTAQKIPAVLKHEHTLQLAIYCWLLRWAGYTVDWVAIDYFSWDEMRQVDQVLTEPRGNPKPAIEHPLFVNQEYFEGVVEEGYTTLDLGFQHNVVPAMSDCNLDWCRNCPVKYACDIIDVGGEQINPEEYRQEDY